VKVHQFTFGASSARNSAAPGCRKLVLQLLAELPGRFEVRQLLSHAPQMQRMLATASGDPFREVRRAALAARESWMRVA
jgi:DNA repair/transcription protein MET18/MMS19